MESQAPSRPPQLPPPLLGMCSLTRTPQAVGNQETRGDSSLPTPRNKVEPMESASSQCGVCFWKITVTPLCPSPKVTATGSSSCPALNPGCFHLLVMQFFMHFFLSAYFFLLAALDVLHCTVSLQLSILSSSCLAFVHCRIQRYCKAAYRPQTGTRKTFLKLQLDSELSLNLRKGTPFQTHLSALTDHSWFEFSISWAFQHIFHHFTTSIRM